MGLEQVVGSVEFLMTENLGVNRLTVGLHLKCQTPKT